MPNKYVFCVEHNGTVHASHYRKTKGMCDQCWNELLRINKYVYGTPTYEDIGRINKVREELKWKSLCDKHKLVL